MFDKKDYEKSVLSEMMSILANTLNIANKTEIEKIITCQDCMLLLRIEWEDLNRCLRSRKNDGYEPVISRMSSLAATAIKVSAALQFRMKEQLNIVLDDSDDMTNNIKLKKVVSKKTTRKQKTSKV